MGSSRGKGRLLHSNSHNRKQECNTNMDLSCIDGFLEKRVYLQDTNSTKKRICGSSAERIGRLNRKRIRARSLIDNRNPPADTRTSRTINWIAVKINYIYPLLHLTPEPRFLLDASCSLEAGGWSLSRRPVGGIDLYRAEPCAFPPVLPAARHRHPVKLDGFTS